MQESCIAPDLHFMFNYLKRCKLSSSVCHSLLGRENVDGVSFKSLQRAKGWTLTRLLRPKGLVAGLRLQNWTQLPCNPVLAFVTTSGGRTLIESTAQKHGYLAGLKPKDEILALVSCSVCVGTQKPIPPWVG